MTVSAKLTKTTLPTYTLGIPEKNPMFFEKRVYQGQSGKVYPLPYVDEVHNSTQDIEYQVAIIENEFIYLEILPEIGGRIFKGQDKTNHNYDFFYKQDVIKPALVGLAGPWLSGGVEFNWPQHHRPGTYMPTDVFIEEEADGSKTVWMSDHDPLLRMKGMHGVCLRPGSSVIELKVRLFNRTSFTQNFLWWANVAAEVHDDYQSFFPPDVRYVADHAVRAMSSFPVANNDYYGIDYASRTGANDLSWYKNIPVPTSYMVCETAADFFGGYDFSKQGGFVHVANRHIAPGKKQWTWGNSEFGWAWDRELTDEGGPYVELMAGVYTDNQPDFSYLLPYETKTFSQFWWPIQQIGPVQEANEDIALRCEINKTGQIELGLNVSAVHEKLLIRVTENDQSIHEELLSLKPGEVWQNNSLNHTSGTKLVVSVFDATGKCLGSFSPIDENSISQTREVAQEPLPPAEIATIDELYLIGEHLRQYQHPTRMPEIYWLEALKRDPADFRCNLSLGKQALKRGEFEKSLAYINEAISKLTRYHPNPETGEAHYFSGLAAYYLGKVELAYSRFYKAIWNFEWRSAGYYQLARLDMANQDYTSALEHLKLSVKNNTENNNAYTLMSICHSQLGDNKGAKKILQQLLGTDGLDVWASWELAKADNSAKSKFACQYRNDAQTILDLAFEYVAIKAYDSALELIDFHLANPVVPTSVPNPLQQSQVILFLKAWLFEQKGNNNESAQWLSKACAQNADYFFPSRLQEQVLLEWAAEHNSHWLIGYGLGNYYYDKRRHKDAIEAWEKAAQNCDYATVFRNLGIAYWNIEQDEVKAREAYLTALKFAGGDARLVFEYDQLTKRSGDLVEHRLQYMQSNLDLVLRRDDACIEYCALLNDSGQMTAALDVLTTRRFHPWEGGEGKVLAQYTRAKIKLGQQAFAQANFEQALAHFEFAFETPGNLGEAYHLLQAKAEVNYWLGMTLTQLGQIELAKNAFEACANENNDFQNMAVVSFSELSYFKGLALIALTQFSEAQKLFNDMLAYVETETQTQAKIPYFATSLPNLLVFEDDIQQSRDQMLDLIASLAKKGLALLAECENNPAEKISILTRSF